MHFKILDQVKALEEQIFKGYNLWIFRGYVAVNKRGVEKIFDEIYATLPQDVQEARSFLENHPECINTDNQCRSKVYNIYDVLKELELLLEGHKFMSYAIVDKDRFAVLNEELKDAIPSEIYQAEKYNR